MSAAQQRPGGKVRELLVGKRTLSSVISVKSGDSLLQAVRLMHVYGVSQLPVTVDGAVIGSLDEDVVMRRLYEGVDPAAEKVEAVMTDPLPQVDEDEDIEHIYVALVSGAPGIVVTRDDRPVGLITRIDLLAFWSFGQNAFSYQI